MVKNITKSSWAKRIDYDNGLIVTIPSMKKNMLSLVSFTAGAYVMYNIGSLLGEEMNNIPYLNEWIPQAVNYVSGIDVKGNIDGLIGILGGFYGIRNSGVSLNDRTLELEKISAAPFYISYKKNN